MKNFLNDFITFSSKYKSLRDIIENLYLPAIIESYQRVVIIDKISSLLENQIRDKFVLDFQNQNSLLKKLIANNTLKFTNENRIITEQENFRTDIEFFISSYGNFVVECKRLNSAEDRYIKGREVDNEYKIDGIERFITQAYSANDQYAGMMSFINKGNPKEITQKLLEKVKKHNLHLGSENLLKEKCADWEFSFKSKHNRLDKTHIIIYHLFFDFTQN